MSIGAIIWNNITQDLTQYGGLWSRRPVSGLAFVVSAAGLLAFPPWVAGIAEVGRWSVAGYQPGLVGVLLVVNALTAFSLTRVFSLIFGGQTNK